ncbi:MAG: hypothetical protein RLZZ256_1048, partial [Bacteroidota bacterium]
MKFHFRAVFPSYESKIRCSRSSGLARVAILLFFILAVSGIFHSALYGSVFKHALKSIPRAGLSSSTGCPIDPGSVGNAQTICSGTIPPLPINSNSPGTETGTPTPGASLSYAWESSVDGINWTLIAGANAIDYQPGSLSVTTQFRRKVSLLDATSIVLCSAYSNIISITVTQPPTATISYTGTPFCTSLTTAQLVTLTGSGAYTGGSYSASPAGLSINTATGAITPSTSTPGTYTVNYTIPASAGCASVTATATVV